MKLPSSFFRLAVCGGALVAGATAAEPAASSTGTNSGQEILAESVPFIKSWMPAEFPASVPPAVKSGTATTRIIVDETGAISAARVLDASTPAFGDAALAAVKQWTFSPGVDNGKRAAMCLDVPFEFVRGKKSKTKLLPEQRLLPRLAPRTSATLEDDPLGDYPETLVGRGLPGQVTFNCRVNADGKASEIRILQASHADFVLPALASSANWRFKPATQGDLTLSAEMEGEVMYSDTKTPPRSKVLSANGITAPDGSDPEYAPQPIAMVDPVWPYALLLEGKDGAATVAFTVTGNGVVTDAHVRDATDPAFGAALLAAVSAWRFDPAMAHGVGQDVALVKHADFKAVPNTPPADADDWLARLVKLARTHAIGGGRGLDEKLTPIYRISPVAPDGTDGEHGQAVIEFVIDRDGRARLPRIVSATKDAYGWAAATAVSQWIFKAPKRGGNPTELKVQIPMAF